MCLLLSKIACAHQAFVVLFDKRRFCGSNVFYAESVPDFTSTMGVMKASVNKVDFPTCYPYTDTLLVDWTFLLHEVLFCFCVGQRPWPLHDVPDNCVVWRLGGCVVTLRWQGRRPSRE